MMKRKWLRTAISYFLVVAAVLAVSVLAIVVVGKDFAKALEGFLRGVAGSTYGVAEVLVRAEPLLLAGLGVSIAFRAGFFNIGSEGQIYMGAAAFTAVGLAGQGLPWWLLMPLALLAGCGAGGLWSAVPGLLKTRFGLSETINTIMLNYIAVNLVGIFVRTFLKDPANPLPMSPELPESASLPTLLEGTRLHAGFLVALAAVLFVHVLMRRTKAGFTMRVVGENPRAARAAGLSVYGNVILASALSGILAGLAGAAEIAGIHHRLLEGISPGFGYLAIIVALLGKNEPFGILASSLLIAALQVGANSMQRQAGVPTSISWIIMGLVVVLALARPTALKAFLEGGKEAGR